MYDMILKSFYVKTFMKIRFSYGSDDKQLQTNKFWFPPIRLKN
jgi:hypothetical protein